MENRETILTSEETRVLACLIEKALITPDNYPLTLHSLTLACNQKSSREPIMKFEEGHVGHIVKQLAERELVLVDYSGRVSRYTQRLTTILQLNRREQAVLSVLMLRYPQTLNHIRLRTERMVEFESLDELREVVDHLISRDPPLALHIPKGPGQREDRFTHILCGETVPEPAVQELEVQQPRVTFEVTRLNELEKRVEVLEERLSKLLGESEGD